MMIAKLGFRYVCDAPLNTISSPRSSLLKKAVAAVAMAIFTVLSLGYYVVYANRFFANKKFENATQELKKAVDQQDVERVKFLFEKFPALKKTLNGEIGTPFELGMAISKKNFKLAKLLVQNGQNIDVAGRGSRTPLFFAVHEGNLEGVKWLLANGSNPNKDNKYPADCPFVLALHGAFDDETVRLKMIKLLLDHGANPTSPSLEYSLLAYVAQNWDKKDSVSTKYILRLMIDKGATLEAKKQLKIPPEAEAFIKEYTAQKAQQANAA